MKLTLSGQTPSQKNAKHIAINKRTGQRFPMTDPAVKQWQLGAMMEAMVAKNKYRPNYTDKVYVTYMFYVKDNRRRDIDNMIASCDDRVVKSGIIKDDSWKYLAILGADAEVDSSNPRAVIVLDISISDMLE